MRSKFSFFSKVIEKIAKIEEGIYPKIEEFSDSAKEKIQETKENLAPKIAEFKEKTKETANQAKEKMRETKENLVPKATEFKEKTKEMARRAVKFVLATICAITLFMIVIFSNGRDLYVISIGVPAYNEYNRFKDIESCEEDAEKISSLLKKSSEELFGRVEIRTIAQYSKATKHKILGTINDVYEKAKKNDVILIYFSGHGITAKNEDYFLLPFDSKYNDIPKTGIKPRKLVGNKDIKTIIWIDACYSGMAAKTLAYEKVNLLVSSKADNPSYCKVNDRSIFTREILEGLENCEADYNEDGKVSLEELARYVGPDKNPLKKFQDLNLVKCNK
ncbi:MAG: caspase family protein [Candidatus Fibromonas sp.]|jgi:hypothetical protein|nr:caspase family protein [Candidatus Fibromonas sp.]